MISFWRQPHARHERDGAPSAAMRFPVNVDWTVPFREDVDGADDSKPKRTAPVPVAQLWTAVGAADDRGSAPLPPYEACWQGF
jgi:hypothetical protein